MNITQQKNVRRMNINAKMVNVLIVKNFVMESVIAKAATMKMKELAIQLSVN